jgi:hypothetical protein
MEEQREGIASPPAESAAAEESMLGEAPAAVKGGPKAGGGREPLTMRRSRGYLTHYSKLDTERLYCTVRSSTDLYT